MGSGSSKTTTTDGLDHPHALLRTDVEIGVTTSSHSVSPKLGGDDDDSKCVRGKENDLRMIDLHKELVWGFFRNARHIVRQLGEVHESCHPVVSMPGPCLNDLPAQGGIPPPLPMSRIPSPDLLAPREQPWYQQRTILDHLGVDDYFFAREHQMSLQREYEMKRQVIPLEHRHTDRESVEKLEWLHRMIALYDGKDTEEQSHCSPSWSSEGNLKYTLIFILELLPMAKLAKLWRELLTPTSKGGGGAGTIIRPGLVEHLTLSNYFLPFYPATRQIICYNGVCCWRHIPIRRPIMYPGMDLKFNATPALGEQTTFKWVIDHGCKMNFPATSMRGILFELVGPIHISRDPGTIPRPAASLQRCCASDTRTSHYLGLFTLLKGKHIDEVAKSKQSTVSTKTKKFKEIQFQKLQRLPDGCHPDFDNDHLCSINNHDLLPKMSTPSADLHLLPETGVENMRTPKSLHAELKRELSKLNTVLKLPYWCAASFLKYTELDHRESLALASDGLNYECNEAPS
ncbi:hypothetical protein Zm00014a_041080 [Zea mays]|uniref:MOM1 alpha-helical domain-containing protein n=1 Tax=Zea mays TaxID=4577 RepID=A0A317Y4U9_MAIZE|nr:hypothetical protein Zm00014a_041080 [Zea mays]